MITRFRVDNYKALKSVDIQLSKLHVIIGQNDSGKTSLLEAIHAFCRSARPVVPISTAFEGKWQGRDLVYLRAKEPQIDFSSRLEGTVDQKKVDIGYGFRVDFEMTPPHVENEWRFDGGERVVLPSPGNTSFVSSRFITDFPYQHEDIADLLGTSAFYRFEPKVMAIPATIDENRKFRMDPDGFGLATVLDDILGFDPKKFLQLSKEFCEFFPEFRQVRIRTEPASSRRFDPTGLHTSSQAVGKGIAFETTDGGEIRAQQASDGAMLFLGFLSLLYVPEPPKVLLIEEPEKGVYPKRLEEIIGLMKRVIESRSEQDAPQIIFTTHSPFILSQFAPDQVTLMSRRGDHVIARSLGDAPHIEDRMAGGEFYLGELWYNLSEEELFQDEPVEQSH